MEASTSTLSLTVKAPGTANKTTFLSFHSSVEIFAAGNHVAQVIVADWPRYLRTPQAACIQEVSARTIVRSTIYIVIELRGVRYIAKSSCWERIADFDSGCHG